MMLVETRHRKENEPIMGSRQVPEKAPAAMVREITNVAKPTLIVWLRLCLDTGNPDLILVYGQVPEVPHAPMYGTPKTLESSVVRTGLVDCR